MKLSQDRATINSKKSIQEVIDEAIESNEYFFTIVIADEAFVYRPITRKEYKDIIEQEISDEEKKDIICKKCLLYPDSYDFDRCIAGIPEQLSKDIIQKSALDPLSVISLMSLGRDEMEDLSAQMVCIIANEFPAYRIEEIESWNMYKLVDMFTKAEWKRRFYKEYNNEDIGGIILESLINASGINDQKVEENEDKNSEVAPRQEVKNTQKTKGMSDEEYQKYLKFQQQFPEIDMSADAAFTGYDEKMKVDTLPPALRPGWG